LSPGRHDAWRHTRDHKIGDVQTGTDVWGPAPDRFCMHCGKKKLFWLKEWPVIVQLEEDEVVSREGDNEVWWFICLSCDAQYTASYAPVEFYSDDDYPRKGLAEYLRNLIVEQYGDNIEWQLTGCGWKF